MRRGPLGWGPWDSPCLCSEPGLHRLAPGAGPGGGGCWDPDREALASSSRPVSQPQESTQEGLEEETQAL